MAVRTDIQYVQFYVDGSTARKLEKKQQAKHAATPRQRKAKRKVVVVDPVAIFGVLVAVFMLVFMLVGVSEYRATQAKNRQMDQYIAQLQQENMQLEQAYKDGYDLDQIRDIADALGMIPKSEATHVQVPVQTPQEETVTEMSWWESFTTFLAGLFA